MVLDLGGGRGRGRTRGSRRRPARTRTGSERRWRGAASLRAVSGEAARRPARGRPRGCPRCPRSRSCASPFGAAAGRGRAVNTEAPAPFPAAAGRWGAGGAAGEGRVRGVRGGVPTQAAPFGQRSTASAMLPLTDSNRRSTCDSSPSAKSSSPFLPVRLTGLSRAAVLGGRVGGRGSRCVAWGRPCLAGEGRRGGENYTARRSSCTFGRAAGPAGAGGFPEAPARGRTGSSRRAGVGGKVRPGSG